MSNSNASTTSEPTRERANAHRHFFSSPYQAAASTLTTLRRSADSLRFSAGTDDTVCAASMQTPACWSRPAGAGPLLRPAAAGLCRFHKQRDLAAPIAPRRLRRPRAISRQLSLVRPPEPRLHAMSDTLRRLVSTRSALADVAAFPQPNSAAKIARNRRVTKLARKKLVFAPDHQRLQGTCHYGASNRSDRCQKGSSTSGIERRNPLSRNA